MHSPHRLPILIAAFAFIYFLCFEALEDAAGQVFEHLHIALDASCAILAGMFAVFLMQSAYGVNGCRLARFSGF